MEEQYILVQRGSEIQPSQHGKGGIWLSGYQFASNQELLRKQGIKAVVTAADIDIQFQKQVKNLKFQLIDDQGQQIMSNFQKCFSFIEENIKDTNVLVHCAAGISRSSTMLCAYLMKKNKWTCQKALEFIKKGRSIICPNSGFKQQLLKYEHKLNL